MMMSEGSSSNDTGGGGGRPKTINQVEGLKKGPWTAAEDEILMEYVRVNGEGNWNAVQKNTRLMRCGKSCRLRWANHLRPNLKKGSFTREEERIIIELHSKLGNKWARMASQLPGRTDNEIKNFWNTRLKRRQRAGLPIYTPEIQDKTSNNHEFQFQHNQQNQQKHHYNPSSPSSNNYIPSLTLIDPFTTTFSSSFDSMPNHLSSSSNSFYPTSSNHTNLGGLGFNLSPLYLQSPPSNCSNHMSQSIETQSTSMTPPSQTLNYNNLDDLEGNNKISFTSLMMGGAQVDPRPSYAVSSLNQISPTTLPITPVSSNASGSVGASVGAETSSMNIEVGSKMVAMQLMGGDRNSGLLDALVQDSKNHDARKVDSDDENSSQAAASEKGKRLVDLDESSKDAVTTKRVKLSLSDDDYNSHHENLSSSQDQIGTGIKPSEEEQVEELNSMDDDLMSLLNNFPSSMPLPEWYQRRTPPSTNVLSCTTNDHQSTSSAVDDHESNNNNNNIQPTDKKSSITSQITTTTDDRSCYWNNMPRIC